MDGYADTGCRPESSSDWLDNLTTRRAKAATSELLELGVPKDQLTSRGSGANSLNPLFKTMMPANQNRRVYIYCVDEEAFFAQRLQADDFSLEQQLI